MCFAFARPNQSIVITIGAQEELRFIFNLKWNSNVQCSMFSNCEWFFFFISSFLQLVVEVLFLATASISGLYYRIMSDAAHNRTVDGTRTGIQQRVKLECEREQQEQLLLSVIPAYIAAEVSAIPLIFHSFYKSFYHKMEQTFFCIHCPSLPEATQT